MASLAYNQRITIFKTVIRQKGLRTMAKVKAPAAPKAEPDVDPEKPVTWYLPTRQEAPGEYIAHQKRLDNLRLALISKQTELSEVFGVQVLLTPEPDSIKPSVTGEVAPELNEAFLKELDAAIDSLKDDHYKAYMHYRTYLRLRRENKRNLADLDEQYNRQRKELVDLDQGFEFRYHANFIDLAKSQIMAKRQPDGTWKSGDKTIHTLEGSYSMRSTGGVNIESKEALNNFLIEQRELVDTGFSEGLSREELEEATKARDRAIQILETLKVEFKKETVETIKYSVNDIKPYVKTFKLPGFVEIPEDPLGSLSID